MPETRAPPRRFDPNRFWYGPPHPLVWALAPFGALYCGVARLRALAYRRGWRASTHVGIPTIVVGNVTVGGTGKTPLTLWLAAFLRARGWHPGIATRGYGGRTAATPCRVPPVGGDPARFGDEALLLAEQADCPVACGRDRVAVARQLCAAGCDLILCDDGLQHYRLARDLEIALIDGHRGFGNGHCLPAGPLREPLTRLRAVDWTLTLVSAPGARGHRVGGDWALEMRLGAAVNLGDPGQTRALADFADGPVVAVAGIAHPERFFRLLEGAGLRVERWPYPDHHRFAAAEAARWPDRPVLMTAKDAVKCRAFAAPRHWVVPLEVRPDARFVAALAARLDTWGHR